MLLRFCCCCWWALLFFVVFIELNVDEDAFASTLRDFAQLLRLAEELAFDFSDILLVVRQLYK
jgi:hypothetical protein